MCFSLARIAPLVAFLLTAIPVSPLRAQAPAKPDTNVRKLAPVVVSAAAPSDATGRGNRSLARQLREYDQRIGRLEAHLDSLKTVATVEIQRDIAELADAAAQTRARRLYLEMQLDSLKTSSVVRADSARGHQ
jgi:hypothetical protein